MGIYYLVNLENTDFNHFESVFELIEDSRVNTYEWLDIDSLDSIALYPLFVKTDIKNPDKNLKHIITNEMANNRDLL